MSFGEWRFLFLLFVPAMLLAWIWLRDRLPVIGLGSDRRVALPQDFGVAKSGRWTDFFIRCFMSAAPLMMAMAIILLAGPRRLGLPQAERELTNIEFCLDLSGSMDGEFGEGTRYDAAIQAINDFVDQRTGDAFGLTVFGSRAYHWIPLTTDPSAFRCSVPFLEPSKVPPGYGGGTRIGLGLMKCREVLVTREKGDRMIVLVSDGMSADLDGGADEVVARLLLEDNIVVYSIHIGSGGTPPEVAAITNITGGRSFNPEDTRALEGVFHRIDIMEVAELEQTYAELLDYFWPFSIAGISCVGMTLLSMVLLRYTPW